MLNLQLQNDTICLSNSQQAIIQHSDIQKLGHSYKLNYDPQRLHQPFLRSAKICFPLHNATEKPLVA